MGVMTVDETIHQVKIWRDEIKKHYGRKKNYEETLDYNKERILRINSNDIHSNLKAFQFLIWKGKGRERGKATFLYPSSM